MTDSKLLGFRLSFLGSKFLFVCRVGDAHSSSCACQLKFNFTMLDPEVFDCLYLLVKYYPNLG